MNSDYGWPTASISPDSVGPSLSTSSPGSTIDDPDLTDEEPDAGGKSIGRFQQTRQTPTPPLPSSPTSNAEVDPQAIASPKSGRGSRKPRTPKATFPKIPLASVQQATQDTYTEDESGAVPESHNKRTGRFSKKSDSRRNSEADVKPTPPTATAVGTRRQANGTIGSVYSGNKIRHIKKDDGVALWRKDIQYQFLRTVFEDKNPVFTRISDGQTKCNFADIYIDAMARSSKTSKVLKDKLQSDRVAAENMAMICLLVNVGRMNTTLNFFPEMRAQLRTYHAIPSLQARQKTDAYKQLQDAPRLKSILKGASEDTDEPRTVEAIKALPIPRTNPVNLIFVLSQYAPKISELHFSASVDFFDLVIRHTISSKSRARAFLWLMWWYLESNFTESDARNNPFGSGTYEAGNRTGIPLKVPEFEHLTEEQGNAENVDPEEELTFGEEKRRERKRILEDDEAENKFLKRVKKGAVGDDALSDYDSAAGRSTIGRKGSPAIRDALGFAIINMDPSTSRLGGQAESLDDDWEPVDPHPGRGRYKRVKNKDKVTAQQSAHAQAHPSNLTSSSGRTIFKTSKTQIQRSDTPPPPADPRNASLPPAPPGSAHPILHQYGLSTETLARGSIGTFGNEFLAPPAAHRRPRPLTAHQLAVEANRRSRIEYLLAAKKKDVFEELREKRERSNFVLKAAQRIKDLPLGYDSEDELTSWGMGGLGPNPNGGEEDDFGEEAESWIRVILRVQRRLDRWSGDEDMTGSRTRPHGRTSQPPPMDPSTPKQSYEYAEDANDEMEDAIMEKGGSSPVAVDAAGLDEIDKSLLAERSDDEMRNGESEDASGEESDVEME